MNDDLTLAYALARALTEGKNTEELSRLQIILQTVCSLVSAELGCRRLQSNERANDRRMPS